MAMEMDDNSSNLKKELVDIENEEDDSDGEKKHAQLLDAIVSLGGQHKPRLTQRSVPGLQVSEFAFGASEDVGKVQLTDLVKCLTDTRKHGKLKKQLRAVDSEKKVVPAPPSKLETERLKRTIAYENTKADISKWEPVIKENRKSSQLVFPLNQPQMKLLTTDQQTKRIKPFTPLEFEIAALLKGSDNIDTGSRELTPAEEKALRAMSLEEAQARRAELQKYRALLSYKQAKAKRQNKIKSKKYRQILRKEKEKTERKNLEILKQKDPEAYIEKLQEADRNRIQERMSLKHRGGSKFARKTLLYGKFNLKNKQAVNEMILKNRELTQKIEMTLENDSDENVNTADEVIEGDSSLTEAHNPWMNSLQQSDSLPVNKISENENGKTGDENEVSTSPIDKCRKTLNTDSDAKNFEMSFDYNSKLSVEQMTDKNVQTSNSDKEKLGKIGEKLLKRKSQKCQTNIKSGDSEIQKSVESSKKVAKKSQVIEGDSDDIENIFEKLEKKKISPAKLPARKKMKNLEKKNTKENNDDEDVSDEEGLNESLTRKKTLEDMDDLAQQTEIKPQQKSKKKKKRRKQADKKIEKQNVPKDFIAPNKVLPEEKTIDDTLNPDIVDDDDAEVDHEEKQRLIIKQAFADDDVVDEFLKEKSDIIDNVKPKDIDLTLPGWGEWGGSGLEPSSKKRRKFLIKAPTIPRKDDHLDKVIISEHKDKAFEKLQVSDLPFPYMNTKQFEQTIRVPVGKDWNPEMAFKKMVEPKVVTKMGTIITPIDKEETFRKYQDIKKNTPR